MYPLLRRGMRMPSVAALQILLNRRLADPDGLAVDGIFGPKTQRAVKRFQRTLRIADSGIVDGRTWQELSAGTRLQVVDAVDVWDPDLLRQEHRAIGGYVRFEKPPSGIGEGVT